MSPYEFGRMLAKEAAVASLGAAFDRLKDVTHRLGDREVDPKVFPALAFNRTRREGGHD